MPLISCPDCRSTISDRAPACNKCGCPIAADAARTQVLPRVDIRSPTASAPERGVVQAVSLVSTAVIVLGVFLILLIRTVRDYGKTNPGNQGSASASAIPSSSAAPSATAATTLAVGGRSGSARDGLVGEMVAMPAGVLLRGAEGMEDDEKPTKEIPVSAFFIDKSEVTVAAWDMCVKEKGCKTATSVSVADLSEAENKKWSVYCNGGKAERPNHPMNCVDWAAARGFCEWASKRLPTEDEWEYAARGVTTADAARSRHLYPWGDAVPSIKLLNACDRTCVKQSEADGFSALKEMMIAPSSDGSDGYPTTAPVRRFPANPFGLFDMAGNVSEWTASWYGSYDLAEVTSGTKRVNRGGNWTSNKPASVRVSKRSKDPPTTRDAIIGFRCARSG
jgi:formylglycine-generating enzyme required for sulfatase activity